MTTYSKVWQNLNLSLFLSSQQINDTFVTISSTIENQKIITNEKIHILVHLFHSDQISVKNRQNLCELLVQNFCISNQTHSYCGFIDLFNVLLPNAPKSMLLKLMTKIKSILAKTQPSIDLVLNVSKLLCHLSIIEIPAQLENQFINIIVLIIEKLFNYTTNFYAKYSFLTAMTNISLKSKYKSIITECCKNDNIKQQLKQHLNKLKVISI